MLIFDNELCFNIPFDLKLKFPPSDVALLYVSTVSAYLISFFFKPKS